MPIFEVQGPDGKTYEVDAPDMQRAASAFAPMSEREQLREEGRQRVKQAQTAEP